MTLEVLPFGEEHLSAAAVLLAERHRRHRAAEPLLPAAFEEADAAGSEIEQLLRSEGADGVVALREGHLVGYLIGAARDEAVWGPNAWVEHAGHAASDPEDVRDLYAAVAQGWFDAGRTRHFAMVPASDAGLVDAWFRLSFGQQQVYAIRKVDTAARRPGGVRHAEPRDVDALVALAPLLPAVQDRAPTFARRLAEEDPAELRADIEEEIASERTASLVAEVDGRVVGSFILAPVELSSSVVGLARPPGQCHLAWAATDPSVRGTGTGLALMQAADAWARDAGYSAMTVDCRVANLLASRFWPKRGFRPIFLRLHRTI
ncbi:MAG TPA: GNAT family N-acetyltransferase [Gaiellales bacterium]|nr:GNAT family N-acetyltransferase [Gaiellales bacterium]